ncbi:MAG TPA: hypothetical protein VMF11_09400 [Candidatus Baltobacteraceae bacterium]|nr:hypothetical protein [Candidatus Baltobacteraceae bacterium]
MHARFAFFGAVIFAAALVACGGGGGGSSSPPTSPPTSTPTGSSTYTTTVTLGASATSAPFSVLGYSGTASVPAGSGTVTVTISTTPNPAVLDLKHRMQTNPANSPLVYITITSTGSATLDAFPGFTVSGVPASSSPYFLAWYYSGGQTPAWTSTTETGENVSGSGTLTIPTLAIPTALTINASSPLQLALYSGNYIPPINIFGCVNGNASPPPSGSAIAHSNAVGVHPITSGDSYTYGGSLVQTITRYEPCPQPTATAAATVAIDVTTNGTQETDDETDTYALLDTTLDTVANVSSSISGGTTTFYETSETATDGNNNAETTTYTSPGLIYAEVPESSSQSWTNAAPASVNQTLNDGEAIDQTYGAGGTYSETDTIPGGYSNQIAVSADGSGSYSIGLSSGSPLVEYAFSAPSSSGITLTITAPGEPTSTMTIPEWFTTTTFYSDSTKDEGTVGALGTGCTFPITGSNGTPDEIVRTISVTDPVLGYTETETIDNYDLADTNSTGTGTGSTTLGPVCSIITDDLSEYYDYSLTTPFSLFYTEAGQPVLTNDISETLNLSQSGLVADVARRTLSSSAMSEEINARALGIRFTRSLQRAKTMETFAKYMVMHGIAGGVK